VQASAYTTERWGVGHLALEPSWPSRLAVYQLASAFALRGGGTCFPSPLYFTAPLWSCT
jgi:hypothetical protein